MFNDRYGLTEAVLSGRKTQTRRIIPNDFFSLNWDVRYDTLVYENDFGDFIDIRRSKYARYKVGEVVAVAQRYSEIFDKSNCVNPFDYEEDEKQSGWTNKMFVRADLMPHQIRITNVCVERLQDISDEDCIAEGILDRAVDEKEFYDGGKYRYGFYSNDNKQPASIFCQTPQDAYATLIDMISGKGTWESNPFVFAYDFELVKLKRNER